MFSNIFMFNIYIKKKNVATENTLFSKLTLRPRYPVQFKNVWHTVSYNHFVLGNEQQTRRNAVLACWKWSSNKYNK